MNIIKYINFFIKTLKLIHAKSMGFKFAKLSLRN